MVLFFIFLYVLISYFIYFLNQTTPPLTTFYTKNKIQQTETHNQHNSAHSRILNDIKRYVNGEKNCGSEAKGRFSFSILSNNFETRDPIKCISYRLCLFICQYTRNRTISWKIQNIDCEKSCHQANQNFLMDTCSKNPFHCVDKDQFSNIFCFVVFS